MSGYTKKMSQKFLFETKLELNKYIKKIRPVLPIVYDFEVIMSLLTEFYPFKLQMIEEKCSYFQKKDDKISRVKGKSRHNTPLLEKIVFDLKAIKELQSCDFMIMHKVKFDKNEYEMNYKKLKDERELKISKIRNKVEKAKLRAQSVEPEYLDKLIGLYERKNTSQEDKVYIFKELEKYYCKKTVDFFKKKVDSEYNRQLREMAFYHLQALSHHSSLRKQKYMLIPSKNKKRRKFMKEVYANQRFKIESLPRELEYRVENAREQKIKEYDFFISHSSKDFKEVQEMIKIMNSNNMNVYCDWISDNDYLKRHLVGNATKNIIEKRLEKSKNMLFIKSETSIESKWVKYELNYFRAFDRNIFEISKYEINQGITNYIPMKEFWFIEDDYKSITLY